MDMRTSRVLLLAGLLSLCGCASQYEGVYEPACIAFAGDKIEFRDGRFEWERFTDQRRIDKRGNPVDPYPDYPKRGQYRMDEERMLLRTDAGERLDDWYVLEHLGETYLLTFEQSEAFLNGEGMATCALRRVNERD